MTVFLSIPFLSFFWQTLIFLLSSSTVAPPGLTDLTAFRKYVTRRAIRDYRGLLCLGNTFSRAVVRVLRQWHLVWEETRENRSVCFEIHLRALFCFILSVAWLAASWGIHRLLAEMQSWRWGRWIAPNILFLFSTACGLFFPLQIPPVWLTNSTVTYLSYKDRWSGLVR